MKKTIINISILLLIASCSLDKKDRETVNTNSTEEIDSANFEPQTKVDSSSIDLESQSPDSLLSFFKLIDFDSLKVTAKNDIYSSYSGEEEIPFSYQPLFNGYLHSMGRSSTGYLPKGYLQINDSLAFLIIFIQDDYGPVYHGLEYNIATHEIRNSQILAREWGDAGDSQTIYTELELRQQTLTINKFISTCHAELDFDSDPVKIIFEDCKDSSYVATLQ